MATHDANKQVIDPTININFFPKSETSIKETLESEKLSCYHCGSVNRADTGVGPSIASGNQT